MQRVPARIGDPLAAVETPALVVDLDAFEHNLDLMANAVRGSGLALRPHAKSHKCPDIAKAQVARGAVGICCQKVDEAAAFVAAGIANVLVTNEIVAPAKIARLAALARSATIGVLVDDMRVIADLSAAASLAGGTLHVYVEIDVGAHRCGVASGEAAVPLARAIAAAPGLAFRGLHAYHGAAQHLRRPEQRLEAIAAASRQAADTKAAIERAGVACPVVTGAGTGTWQLERDSRIYTELQPGSYVFMDADYLRNALSPDQHHFEHSLYVLATVMSTPTPERAIVDAGLKALAFDSGPPLVHVARGLEYVKASDEHGVLEVDPKRAQPALGDRVWLIPGHCDPTVNLYDWIVGMRGERVECVWPVAARGALG
ncbi:MAG: DSD1 family PLP-dependent enzyme [Betaproteobacteria bacterium]|nr:DSD1 family PLP-dependent enzyme [Betaproteobacteria bacterium]